MARKPGRVIDETVCDRGFVFNPSLCVMRHTAARKAVDQKQKSKTDRYKDEDLVNKTDRLCAYCPLVIAYLGDKNSRKSAIEVDQKGQPKAIVTLDEEGKVKEREKLIRNMAKKNEVKTTLAKADELYKHLQELYARIEKDMAKSDEKIENLDQRLADLQVAKSIQVEKHNFMAMELGQLHELLEKVGGHE